MIPGPDKIIACPHCRGRAKHMTLTSGNTISIRTWSDGYQFAPMFPGPPAIVRCSHCKECYWLSEAEEVGTIDHWNELKSNAVRDWQSIKSVEEPTEYEYYTAIDKNLAKNQQQEKSLRIYAWWKRNDQYRDSSDSITDVPVSKICRENLVALCNFLDEDSDDEKIMKAEVLREPGDFDSAKELLSQKKSC